MQHYGSDDARGCRHVDRVLKDRKMRRKTRRVSKKRGRKPSIFRVGEWEGAVFGAQSANLFSCPLCRDVLEGPVTAHCGHTFCGGCLTRTDCARCVVCKIDIGNRAVNVLVQDLVEKWRDRNKGGFADSTDAFLGIQPRYHLRSGFTGLEYRPKTRNKKIVNSLKSIMKEIDDIREKATRDCWEAVAPADLECILCSRCILDPVTTGCGHTFCRGCLTRVLDHRLSCPLCMAALSMQDYSRGTNVALDQAIRFLLPKEYKERLLLHYKEAHLLSQNSNIPVFICTNAFPGVACPLYVYEPRYRLLVRRCLMSPTRRFAMAAKQDSREKFVSFGTVLEVKDAVHLEDGSFILTTLGVRRFRVVSRGEQDGYDTGRIQMIKDVGVSSEKMAELVDLHRKVYDKACKWIQSLTPKILAEVERLIGKMPVVEKNWSSLPDGPAWHWWLMPILPLTSQLQVGFLSSTNLEKRLRAIDKMLERIEIRMKSLERNPCTESEDSSESCSEPERTFEIHFN